MWHEIHTQQELTDFLKDILYFHDSCIKEMNYYSGAYVDDQLSMYPINDVRKLSVILQRQFQDMPMLELEFSGLKCLKLLPMDPNYSCDIQEATIVKHGECFYWCDCEPIDMNKILDYEGTIIIAEKFRWRMLRCTLGQEPFFRATQ